MTTRIGTPALLLALLAVGCSDHPLAPDAREPVATVSVAPADLALTVGGSAPLTAAVLSEDGSVLHGRGVDWSSEDESVATVSAAGVVTARGAGVTAIRAESEGKAGTVAVTVSAPAPAVAWIEITPAGGTIPQAIGTSRQLGVVAHAADGTLVSVATVVWTSSDPAVASVSAAGVLEAHAAGTTTIAADVDGRRATALVSVPTLIARIDLDPTELTLGVGDARTIGATALDAQGAPLDRAFTWSSSNVAVATVDANGRVVATGAGSALITATSEGRTATARVTVDGTQWLLADAAGGPLPAILYATTVDVEGVPRAARWEVTGGTLRFLDGRYALRLHGRVLVEGRDPVAATIASEGVVAYDVFTGAPLLFEGDEWVNRVPRFRTRIRENGVIELDWSLEPGAPVVPLGFAR